MKNKISASILIFMLVVFLDYAYAEYENVKVISGLASWYDTASCQREGTSGIWTATGERFDENALTCAMPDRKMFGKIIKVYAPKTGKTIYVRCNDYGPSKRLVKQGRIIDLSKRAFYILSNGNLKWGLMKVEIEVVNEGGEK